MKAFSLKVKVNIFACQEYCLNYMAKEAAKDVAQLPALYQEGKEEYETKALKRGKALRACSGGSRCFHSAKHKWFELTSSEQHWKKATKEAKDLLINSTR